jgi:hypothetical protein
MRAERCAFLQDYAAGSLESDRDLPVPVKEFQNVITVFRAVITKCRFLAPFAPFRQLAF